MKKIKESPCPVCGRTDKTEDVKLCGTLLSKRRFSVHDFCVLFGLLGYLFFQVMPELGGQIMGASVALYGIARLTSVASIK